MILEFWELLNEILKNVLILKFYNNPKRSVKTFKP